MVFDVENLVLATRAEVDAFKGEHGISTTPLIFIGAGRIGGSADLERYLISSSAD